MTPTWKADMPKTISTVWVHLNIVVDCGLLKTSLFLLLVDVEKAKEK